MYRSIALTLVLALALPLGHLAGQTSSETGRTPLYDAMRASHAFHAALRAGDTAAVAAHLSESFATSSAQRTLEWELVPEHFSQDGEVVRETGSYSRRAVGGPCEGEFVEPKTQRQARDSRFCGPTRATPGSVRETGTYRTTWRRSADGAWQVQRMEVAVRP